MEIAHAWKEQQGLVGVATVGVIGFLIMTSLIVMGISREEPESFAPTALEPQPAQGKLVGPKLFTVDASAANLWHFFSFETGTVVENPGPLDWDLAFRRFQVIANGGPGFAGKGGIVDLGEASLDSIADVPDSGYTANTVRSDTVNAAIENWYGYSYVSHLLTPRQRVYAVRTAQERYAIVQFVGYYCPNAVPGCVTFRYVYQGAGGVDMLGSDRRSVVGAQE